MSSLLPPQVKNGLVCNQSKKVILHTILFLTQCTRSASGIIRIKKKQNSRYSAVCYRVRIFASGILRYQLVFLPIVRVSICGVLLLF